MIAREVAEKTGKITAQAAKYLMILARLGYVERVKIPVKLTSGTIEKIYVYRRNGRDLM